MSGVILSSGFSLSFLFRFSSQSMLFRLGFLSKLQSPRRPVLLSRAGLDLVLPMT